MTRRQPTDLRKQRAQLYRGLTLLAVFVLVIGGGVLIGVFYGASAGLMGLACLLAGSGLIGLLWLVFTLIGKWVNPVD